MARRIKQPVIFSNVDYWNQLKLIGNNLRSHNSIPTKYAYLGWHGAKTWYSLKENVHSKISDTTKLLESHLPSILNKVLYDNKDKKTEINIVSLGIGSGDEDINFLSIMDNSKFEYKINYFAVDYSYDLLAYSIRRIQHFYENLENPKIEINKLIGLCFDIDFPWIKHPTIKSKAKVNRNKLFHLLGYTLGNNMEEAFLRNVLSLMQIDDYLLFDIDYSADDDSELETIARSYKSNTIISNQFLLNSIYYLSNLVLDKKTKSFAVGTNGVKSVKIIYDTLADSSLRSDIKQGTHSLTRRHKYNKPRGSHFPVDQSICDFSNKYESEHFLKWLKRMSVQLGFNIVKANDSDTIFKSENGLTGLVLIKKTERKIAKSIDSYKNLNFEKRIKNGIEWLKDNKKHCDSIRDVEELITHSKKWKHNLLDAIEDDNTTIQTIIRNYKKKKQIYINE